MEAALRTPEAPRSSGVRTPRRRDMRDEDRESEELNVLPAEISEFLVNSLESHVDSCVI